jgi:hypothetical protein
MWNAVDKANLEDLYYLGGGLSLENRAHFGDGRLRTDDFGTSCMHILAFGG